ncbi:hypothetical protein OX284_000775 [Flavobacterium sp. SUN046]|uniref:hypothetical protein n=1 Tax=Flavobacterium sp. SUN046 TaxID=3002440 RepID=UPI002DBB3560|nr:hypothetical protein [Flavobacterium sp. SUN046]MEC4047947.1 hypothetical protein [Flavobacterium sp. SUN046]
MKNICLDFKIYADLIIINLVFLIISILSQLFFNQKPEVIGVIMATGISISFGVRQYKIENDKIFKELFQEFNSKYDSKFNDLLNQIDCDLQNNSYSFDKENRQLIIDYVNFCSEEYLWYKKGRIPLIVWISWKKGMLYFFNLAPIREIVLEQFNQKDSYYGLFDELEFDKNII